MLGMRVGESSHFFVFYVYGMTRDKRVDTMLHVDVGAWIVPSPAYPSLTFWVGVVLYQCKDKSFLIVKCLLRL